MNSSSTPMASTSTNAAASTSQATQEATAVVQDERKVEVQLDGVLASAQDARVEETYFDLVIKFRSQQHELKIASTDTVGDLKVLVFSVTSVPPERQKLIGLIKAKLPEEEVEMGSLGLKPGVRVSIMCVGTPVGEEEIGPSVLADDAGENDIDYGDASGLADLQAHKQRNQRKVKEAVEKLGTIDLMRQPRQGKPLLVLDLDYCILDTRKWKDPSFNAIDFARPYLHEFLAAVSPHYDIAFWSQTHWRWLESKLMELQIIGPYARGEYSVCFVLDRQPMFSVYSRRKGKPFKHEVKALEIIWAKFPDYSAANTLHIDDLSRNFALNPQCGLKIPAYKNKGQRDHELVWITRYLLHISRLLDFSDLDHSKYRSAGSPWLLPDGFEDPVKSWGLE